MANLIKKVITYLIFSLALNSVIYAEDSFFDDELVDDIDVFDDEIISNEKSLIWLDLDISQKWGFNPANNYSTTKERTELKLGTSGSIFDSGYGEIAIKAIKYWPRDSNNTIKTHDAEIEKAFLQFSFNDWSTKLGRYTIGWGELEGGALDLINPYAGITDPKMISQWLLSATHYFNNADLSVFYNSNPYISKIPSLSLKNDNYNEFGVRYGITKEGSDMAFYGAQLVPNSAIINLNDGFTYATPYQLLGFGMNKTFDDYLLKFDIAYKNNLEHNRLGQFIKADRIDWDLAFDIQKNDRQWLISINSQHLLDFYDDYLTPTLTGSINTKKNNLNFIASVSDKFKDSNWSWRLSNSFISNNDLSLTSAGLNWDINDQWKASLDALYMNAKDNRAFSFFDDYQQVNLEVKYQY